MGNLSTGDITQLEDGLDLLGVINMIQIFTLSGYLAECRGLPASSQSPKKRNWRNLYFLMNTFAYLRRIMYD